MIAGGRRGSIINMSSSSVRGQPRGVHYTASKGGVITMTRTMALELAPHGIRVNAIAPGTTDTAQPRGGNTEDELAAHDGPDPARQRRPAHAVSKHHTQTRVRIPLGPPPL
jgi:NAD(P)-dependent dehydrogenase (short-subunit alcohol dehydrogenase family)